MERVVHKSTSHEEARRWDIEQHVSMTVQERQRVAREPVAGRVKTRLASVTGEEPAAEV